MTTEAAFEGIIIRAFPSGDSDLVLRILSAAEGKLAVFARSARSSKKRFGSRLDLFDHGNFEVRSGRGSLPNLQSFTPLSSFKKLRESVERLVMASVVCECFDLLLHEQQNQLEEAAEFYQTILLSLRAIDEAQETKEVLRAGFHGIADLLSRCGYLDANLIEAPSAGALLRLLTQVEAAAEKELVTKGPLVAILKDLKERDAAAKDANG